MTNKCNIIANALNTDLRVLVTDQRLLNSALKVLVNGRRLLKIRELLKESTVLELSIFERWCGVFLRGFLQKIRSFLHLRKHSVDRRCCLIKQNIKTKLRYPIQGWRKPRVVIKKPKTQWFFGVGFLGFCMYESNVCSNYYFQIRFL